MPRTYSPEVEIEYAQYSADLDWHEAIMVEQKGGQWVPLQVFQDEQSRLQHQIRRLQNQLVLT